MLSLIAGGASGALLSLAFPPFDQPAVGLLAVPLLLFLLDEPRTWRRGVIAGTAGLVFFAVHLHWIARFGWYALAALVLSQALFFAAFGMVAGVFARIRDPLLRALAIGGAWAGFEVLRGAVPFGGFPWATLGSALHGSGPARRTAAWVGTSGLSALLVVAGVLVVGALTGRGSTARGLRAPWVALAGALSSRRGRAIAGLVALLALGGLPSLTPEAEVGPRVRVAIVQAGIEAPWRDPPDPLTVLNRHVEITRQLAGEDFDLVLWGENAVEGGAAPETIARLSAEIAIPLSSGAVVDGGDGWLNLVVAAHPGAGEIGRYAKQRPVPFGEYVPLRRFFGRLPVLAREVPRDMLRGTGPVLFPYRFGSAAAVVSYESAFPGVVRRARAAGARLIEVHTNNSSFGRSPASEQHLALDQMRAAELGVPVARAAITGISSLIEPNGEIVDSLGLYETGVLKESVHLGKAPTPYASLGEWTLSYPLVVLSAALMILRPGIQTSVPWVNRRVQKMAGVFFRTRRANTTET